MRVGEPTNKIRFASPRRAHGVSMIEVLVAIVVFSLGLIGLALMQLRGATFTKESGARTMAILQSRSMADRMQANPDGVNAGYYDWNSATQGIPNHGNCAGLATVPAQVACYDIAAWLSQMQAALPAASGSGAALGVIAPGTDAGGSFNGTYVITAGWNGLNVLDPQGQNENISESFVYIPPAGSTTGG